MLPRPELIAAMSLSCELRLKSFLPSRFGNSDRTHWTLCYRWTTRQHIDHWDNTCGHKYNTLTIVKMSSGKKMGGFASARFQGNNQYVRDTQAFLFSLTSGHKHGLTGSSNDQYALYDAAGSFPRWGGGHDFYIYNNEARSGANGYSRLTGDSKVMCLSSKGSHSQGWQLFNRDSSPCRQLPVSMHRSYDQTRG